MATEPQGKYRHFNGAEYRVIGVAQHSETMEELVVYQALYDDGTLWVRPAAMWFERLNRDGYEGPRFTRIDD